MKQTLSWSPTSPFLGPRHSVWACVRLKACTTQVKHGPNCPEKDAMRSLPPWTVGSWWIQSSASLAPSGTSLEHVPHGHSDVASGSGSQLPTVMTRSARIGFPVLLHHPPTVLPGIFTHISYSPLDSCLGVCLGLRSLIPSARAVKSNMNSVLTMNTGEAGPQGTDWGWPCISWSLTPHYARNPPTSSVSRSPDSEGCVLAPDTYRRVTHPHWFQLPRLGLEIKLVLTSGGCCIGMNEEHHQGLGVVPSTQKMLCNI